MKQAFTIEVTFDKTKTNAELVAPALDWLMKTALSTPGVLDECGEIQVGEICPVEEEWVPSKRKFREVVIQIHLVGEGGPIALSVMRIAGIEDEFVNGGWVGEAEVIRNRPITAKRVVKRLVELGSKLDFFQLTETGEDLED